MPCPHLKALEEEMAAAGLREAARGKVWEKAEEFVYFDCLIARESVEARMGFPPFVEWSAHRGTHDGSEAGFFCAECRTGVMGRHPDDAGPGVPVFG